MNLTIFTTSDGSHSLYDITRKVSYRSRFGAVSESKQVFISNGFLHFHAQNPGLASIKVFELGFGTGLNSYLTFIEACRRGVQVCYEAIDSHPIDSMFCGKLNYSEFVEESYRTNHLTAIQNMPWGNREQLAPAFELIKKKVDLDTYVPDKQFDVVYFDPFDPDTQPELWRQPVFEKLYRMMNPQGVLVTYSSKGAVRRALAAAGFEVEKLKGPKGKREVIRAKKNR